MQFGVLDKFVPKNDLQKPSEHIKKINFKNQRKNNNIEERLNVELHDAENTNRTD